MTRALRLLRVQIELQGPLAIGGGGPSGPACADADGLPTIPGRRILDALAAAATAPWGERLKSPSPPARASWARPHDGDDRPARPLAFGGHPIDTTLQLLSDAMTAAALRGPLGAPTALPPGARFTVELELLDAALPAEVLLDALRVARLGSCPLALRAHRLEQIPLDGPQGRERLARYPHALWLGTGPPAP